MSDHTDVNEQDSLSAFPILKSLLSERWAGRFDTLERWSAGVSAALEASVVAGGVDRRSANAIAEGWSSACAAVRIELPGLPGAFSGATVGETVG